MEKKFRGGSFIDERTRDSDGSLLQGCLCFYKHEVLARAIESFERSFIEVLEEVFPGKKKSEILQEVKKMEKGVPLRMSIQRGFTILSRAREKLKELKSNERKEKLQEEKTALNVKKKAMYGEGMSADDWMKS